MSRRDHIISRAYPNFSLHAENLCVERGSAKICSNLSFVLKAGGLLEVLGRNGAGKTSLLRHIVGLSKPLAGSLFWQNLQAGQTPSLTYIAHKPAMKNALTVRQNLSDYARLHEQYNDVAVEQALNDFDLLPWADMLCAEISEGQRRKIALSRLLIEKSALWVLDEPTASLDQMSVARLEAMTAQHLHDGGAVVMATHRPLHLAAANKQTIQL